MGTVPTPSTGIDVAGKSYEHALPLLALVMHCCQPALGQLDNALRYRALPPIMALCIVSLCHTAYRV